MAVEITSTYLGKLACESMHGPSGMKLNTTAPVDVGGTGATFSPTDLVPTALGACILITMGIVAERAGVSLDNSKVRVEKHMVDKPRRIGKLVVELDLPKNLSDEMRAKLERVSHTCPVHQSLNKDIIMDVKFNYTI